MQGEAEEGTGEGEGDAEEEGGADEGEREEEEGDRGYKGANKKHRKNVQSNGKSQPKFWPKPCSEEVLMTL